LQFYISQSSRNKPFSSSFQVLKKEVTEAEAEPDVEKAITSESI
jgi:hypothetical protein